MMIEREEVNPLFASHDWRNKANEKECPVAAAGERIAKHSGGWEEGVSFPAPFVAGKKGFRVGCSESFF